MTRILSLGFVSLWLAVSTSTPARADFFVGNGGDAVQCHGPTFNGFVSYDYLLTYDGGAYATQPDVDHYLAAVKNRLATAAPELAMSLQDFINQLYNTSFTQKRIWQTSPFGLVDVNNGDVVDAVPEDCKQNGHISIVQAVIRQPPSAAGLPPDKILYKYVPVVTQGLAQSNPMQLSFLLLHEWLWDRTTDVQVIHRVVNYFHRPAFFNATDEELVAELQGMGLGTAPVPTSATHRLSMTSQHACFIKADASIECWGENDWHQNNAPTDLMRPFYVKTFGAFACALDDFGVNCWGAVNLTIPAANVIDVASSGYDETRHSYTVCWLANGRVSCTDNDLNLRAPQDVSDFIDIAMAWSGVVCGVSASQGVKCWGWPMSTETSVPQGMVGVTSISEIATDIAFCANASGRLVCWGIFDGVQAQNIPNIGPNDPWKAERITGSETFCGFNRAASRVWCMGENPSVSVIQDLPRIAGVEELDMAYDGACVVIQGRVKCWGSTEVVGSVPEDIRH